MSAMEDRSDPGAGDAGMGRLVRHATIAGFNWLYIPPAEAEANYYRQLASQATEVAA